LALQRNGVQRLHQADGFTGERDGFRHHLRNIDRDRGGGGSRSLFAADGGEAHQWYEREFEQGGQCELLHDHILRTQGISLRRRGWVVVNVFCRYVATITPVRGAIRYRCALSDSIDLAFEPGDSPVHLQKLAFRRGLTPMAFVFWRKLASLSVSPPLY